MRIAHLFRAAWVLAFALVSCRAPESVDPTFTSVVQGSVMGAGEAGSAPGLVVFRSRAAWERERDNYPIEPEAARAIDAVDFSKQSVAVFTLGQRTSGGYAIKLREIEPGPPVRFVLASRRPVPGEMVTQAMTHPFHLVILNATEIPTAAESVLDGVKTDFERHVVE